MVLPPQQQSTWAHAPPQQQQQWGRNDSNANVPVGAYTIAEPAPSAPSHEDPHDGSSALLQHQF